MTTPKFFIIEHDRSAGSHELFQFDDVQTALSELSVRESERRPEMEVVLLMPARWKI